DVGGAQLVDVPLALGAGAQALLVGEVDRLAGLAFLPRVFAEVELELPVLDLVVVGELELGGERPAGLGAEALQRADLPGRGEGLDLVELEAATTGYLADREAAAFGIAGFAATGEAAIVLLHDAAAVRAR